MHPTLVLGTICTLLALASSSPLVETDTNKRSGNQEATAFGSSSCTGTNLGYYASFGCGGTCHTTSGGTGYSFLLSQEKSNGNVNPTASVFSDDNCKDLVNSVGITSGSTTGCTNTAAFNSFYLYYNC